MRKTSTERILHPFLHLNSSFTCPILSIWLLISVPLGLLLESHRGFHPLLNPWDGSSRLMLSPAELCLLPPTQMAWQMPEWQAEAPKGRKRNLEKANTVPGPATSWSQDPAFLEHTIYCLHLANRKNKKGMRCLPVIAKKVGRQRSETRLKIHTLSMVGGMVLSDWKLWDQNMDYRSIFKPLDGIVPVCDGYFCVSA